jgi:UDP-2,3-diacylglucosamine hydrolase
LSKILIISDLHLSEQRPKATELFKKFISSHASKVDELYILGDFFDYWIGDDHDTPFHAYISGLLRTLTSTNIKVFIMRGNRDFLLGHNFAASCGAKLIPDPTVIMAKNTPYLLMHGDSLCTQEIIYLMYRKLVQSNFFKTFFLSLPLGVREYLALRMRKHSQSKQTQNNQNSQNRKYKKWVDVSPRAVKKILEQFNLSNLIHGHTHEFKRHMILPKQPKTGSLLITLPSKKIIDQKKPLQPMQIKERIVLGDWSEKTGSFVFINTEGHAKLHAYSPH